MTSLEAWKTIGHDIWFFIGAVYPFAAGFMVRFLFEEEGSDGAIWFAIISASAWQIYWVRT
jgi:hypothetical protein